MLAAILDDMLIGRRPSGMIIGLFGSVLMALAGYLHDMFIGETRGRSIEEIDRALAKPVPAGLQRHPAAT